MNERMNVDGLKLHIHVSAVWITMCTNK